jgi:uncharacterized protein (TIGR03435 family)
MRARVAALLISAVGISRAQSAHFETITFEPDDRYLRSASSWEPGSVSRERIPLFRFVEEAYDLKSYQISGPAWLKTERYTLQATLPRAATDVQFREMLATVLVERFGLKFHREIRDIDGYELALIPGAGNLTAVEKAEPIPLSQGRGLDGIWRLAFNSIGQLCRELSFQLNARVMDEVLVHDHTGLTGTYNLRFEFRLPDAPSDDDILKGFISAPRDQLGLELKPAKVPTEVLVVDHMSTAIVKAP